MKRYQRLDILVNNAGIFGGRHLAHTTTQAFDEVMNTNLRGTFFCCRAGFKQMQKASGGVIINMSSVAGSPGLGRHRHLQRVKIGSWP